MPEKGKTRSDYIPSKHCKIVRLTLRFDTRDAAQMAAARAITRPDAPDSISTRARSLIVLGHQTRRAQRDIERSHGPAAQRLGRDPQNEID